jgi:hypothetical protein
MKVVLGKKRKVNVEAHIEERPSDQLARNEVARPEAHNPEIELRSDFFPGVFTLEMGEKVSVELECVVVGIDKIDPDPPMTEGGRKVKFEIRSGVVEGEGPAKNNDEAYERAMRKTGA